MYQKMSKSRWKCSKFRQPPASPSNRSRNNQFHFSMNFRQQEQPKQKPSGPFKLDQTYIEEIEQGWVRSDEWEKVSAAKVNMDFLYSPLRCEEVNGVSYPMDKLRNLMANAQTSTRGTTGAHNVSFQVSSPMQNNSSILTPSRMDSK